MADIAVRAGVGIATVDRVLTGRRQVREETARRVYEAAMELSYHATPVIRYRLNRKAPRLTFGFVLPAEQQPFYRELSQALAAAVNDCRDVQGRAIFRYAKAQNPKEYTRFLEELAGQCDVIAGSVINHAALAHVVDAIQNSGVPIFAMLNDFALGKRRKFIGLDNYRAGRLAGWLLANVIRDPGTIAILIGGHLWQAHQMRENGIRSYFRERAPQFTLRDAVLNLEARQITRDMVLHLLETWHDLRGIYITGGGVEGAIAALREADRTGSVHMVVHPFNDDTKSALAEGLVSMVIATPVERLSQALVAEMIAAYVGQPTGFGGDVLLRPEILLPELV